jgi:GT2 family glycosyltransferase
MKPPRFLFVVVTDSSPSARSQLARLFRSLDGSEVTGDVVLVMRGGRDRPPSSPETLMFHPVEAPLSISASRARNLGLEYATRHGLLAGLAIVAFPDDDARFPDGMLIDVATALQGASAMVCVPYAPDAHSVNRKRFPPAEQQLTPALVMRVACTSNVFLWTNVVRRLGGFDERFGLGARYGSSEDTDYVLRALAQGFSGVYHPQLLVEHPYKPHRPGEYYVGNVAVLAKHSLGGGTPVLLARRLASGLAHVLSRKIALREYTRALTAAGAVSLDTVQRDLRGAR